MNNDLNHVGVLGMKWGRRKAKTITSPKQINKAKQKEEKKRAKILSSPSKLLKNLDKFSPEEVKKAMDRMRLERDLRQLNRDKISAGSNYANTILGYGSTAVTAYTIYKSPLGQKIKELIVDALRERVAP